MSDSEGIVYDPSADCPYWTGFIETLCGKDPQRIAQLQRLAGTLLSSLKHQKMFYLYGPAASGKTTFLNGLEIVLGKYLLHLKLDELENVTAGDLERQVRGKFGVIAEGCSDGWLRALHLNLTPLPIVVVSTERPRILADDIGVWHHLTLVPFNNPIPIGSRVPQDVVQQWFRNEASGILNWMIEGEKIALSNV